MAQSMGKDATTEFNKIKVASAGMIDDKALTESANKAMSLGIPIESLSSLMEIARAKSRDMGTTTQQAFNDIATGVGRASPLILDNLGLSLKLGAANEAMAAKLGKTVAELTDQEKKTAILNATIAAGSEALSRYDLSQTTTAEKMQQLTTTIANLKLDLGQGLIKAATGGYAALQYMAAGALGLTMNIFGLAGAYLKYRAAVYSAMGMEEKARKNTEAANDMIASSVAAFEARNHLLDESKEHFALMSASLDMVATATKATGTAATEAAVEDEKAKKKQEDAAKKLEEQIRETNRKIALSAIEYAAQEDEEREKYLKQYEEADKRAAEDEIKRWQKASEAGIEAWKEKGEEGAKQSKATIDRMAKEEKAALDLADKKLNAAKSMYDGMGDYGEEYYETIKTLLEKEADARLKILLQGVTDTKEADALRKASAAKLTSDLEAEEIKRLKASKDWKDGVTAYFKEAEKDSKTAAERMTDALKTFAESSKTAISTTLFDAIKKGTVDFKTVWETWSDSLLQKFTDTVAEMATDFAMNGMKAMIAAAAEPISMVFSAAWDAASAIVLAGIKALSKWFNMAYSGGYVRDSGIGAYAEGGSVPGYATGGDSPANDTVLALLSPGEYVMPRSAVTPETIPYLEYMRENKRPRGYAEGGTVGGALGDVADPYGESSIYADAYKYAGLEYKDGSWMSKAIAGWDDKLEEWKYDYSAVSDPITYAGQYLNDKFMYNLQDENDPPQALDQADYEYLLKWWLSSIQGVNVGGWEDDSAMDQFRTSPLTGSVNPNVVWVEPEGSGYRWYMRDGSDYFTDPGESNWLKRYMPAIIKAVGAVAAVAIATATALPSGGQSYTLLSGIMAAIEGGMTSAPALLGAAGAGLYSGLVTYGETGSVTGSLIAGIIAAAATALSFGSPWGQSETGLYVLKSELNASGYLTSAQGRIIADVIRKGAGIVLEDTLNSVVGGGGSMAISGKGDPGGLDTLAGLFENLPFNKEVSLASGLDYVPYDNFPARLHEGEAVLTKEQNKKGRGITVNFNLSGTVIDKQAVNAFAKAIYPKIKKLEERNY